MQKNSILGMKCDVKVTTSEKSRVFDFTQPEKRVMTMTCDDDRYKKPTDIEKIYVGTGRRQNKYKIYSLIYEKHFCLVYAPKKHAPQNPLQCKQCCIIFQSALLPIFDNHQIGM